MLRAARSAPATVAAHLERSAKIMAKVLTYSNTERSRFCNIELDSGERVMISIASAPTPSLKILQMKFCGMIPRKVIWEINPQMAGGYYTYIQRVMKIFASDPNATTPPLDCMRNFVMAHRSIDDLGLALILRERDAH